LWAQALDVPLTAEFVDHIDRMFFQTTLDHLTPMGDVKGLLGALAARGLKLGLMTNDADANSRAQIQRLGLDSLLGFIAAYDSGYGHKPDPDPVLAFAAFAKVAPAEIAVVGDTAHDLVAARAAGSVAVGVLSGPIPREQLEPHADVLLPSIAELPDWLCSAGSKG
jgi:phosphoglycolate phosphatase